MLVPSISAAAPLDYMQPATASSPVPVAGLAADARGALDNLIGGTAQVWNTALSSIESAAHTLATIFMSGQPEQPTITSPSKEQGTSGAVAGAAEQRQLS